MKYSLKHELKWARLRLQVFCCHYYHNWLVYLCYCCNVYLYFYFFYTPIYFDRSDSLYWLVSTKIGVSYTIIFFLKVYSTLIVKSYFFFWCVYLNPFMCILQYLYWTELNELKISQYHIDSYHPKKSQIKIENWSRYSTLTFSNLIFNTLPLRCSLIASKRVESKCFLQCS